MGLPIDSLASHLYNTPSRTTVPDLQGVSSRSPYPEDHISRRWFLRYHGTKFAESRVLFFLIVLHLIGFKHDSICLWLWRLCVLGTEVACPLEDSAPGSPYDFSESLHGKSITVEKENECACEDRPASVCIISCPLIVVFFTFILLFLFDESIFNPVGVLTSLTVHRMGFLMQWKLSSHKATSWVDKGQEKN